MTITCREWDYLREGKEGLKSSHIDQLHLLAMLSARRLKLPEDAVFSRIHKGLQAGQVVGILAIPGLTVEILPKIDYEQRSTRMALVRMLNVAYDLRIADGELTTLSKQHFDLLEILIQMFANRLLVAVRRGLPRRYLTHHDDLRLLKGKLDVTRQFTRLAVRTDLVACYYDELSPDTPLNRVLKATVLRLSGLSRSSTNIRTLNELKIRFDAVGNSSNPLGERVRLDRTNNAYHELYHWAYLFLKGDYQTTSDGSMRGFSLLFAMNDLFESFIGNSLKKVFAGIRGSRVLLQDSSHSALLNENKREIFKLRPDVVIKTSNQRTIVLDTKWKRLVPKQDNTKFGIEQSDIYQMMAYAHAYQPSRLILLYPWHREFAGEVGILRRWKIFGTNYPLDIAAIDIGCLEKVHYLNNISNVLKEITTLSDRSP